MVIEKFSSISPAMDEICFFSTSSLGPPFNIN
jgi:hypothetical protein